MPRRLLLSVFTFLPTVFFDLLISSSSVMPFRLIYDISFALIMFVLVYTSILLISGEMFSRNFMFVFPRYSYIIPIILNINAIFSIIWLNTPNIGSLNENILTQGLIGLIPFVNFLIVMVANAIILYIIIYGNNDIQLHKIAVYLLVVIAIEICLTIYAFHIAGIGGLRWVLVLFHIAFIGLTIRVYQTSKKTKNHIKIATPDLLLILLSVSIFLMVYIPFGLYNLYSDNAVVVGNTLSIVNRGNLEPYYIADSYYSPIMGFISTSFAYICGLDNLLLSSNLPFLVASLMLPFATYHFLKSFITNDSRIALIGAIIASLMDGLAVILLPVYSGKLTYSAISWGISSATKSLYSTNLSQLWLTPYKSFAAVSAVAACSILQKKRAINYVFGGALFFMSFIDPRLSVLTILLLVFLFGMKMIDVRGIALFVLSVICFGGLTLPAHLYKQLLALSTALYERGLINGAFFSQVSASLKLLVAYEAFPIVIAIVLATCFLMLFLIRSNFSSKIGDVNFTSKFSPKALLEKSFRLSKKRKKLLLSAIDCILFGAVLSMLAYAILHAYLPDTFFFITSNAFLSTANTILLRYHILIIFFAVGLLALKFNRRTAFTIILVISIFYFGGMLANSTALFPIIFAILAIPLFCSLVKFKRKILAFSFLFFVFLGVFSATFYSATVTSPNSTEYSDLPQVLKLLLENNAGEPVYSPSSYTYYVNRVLKMAHLELSSDPACELYIIDKEYIQNDSMNQLLRDQNFIQLYYGYKFVLLKRAIKINW